ncbi:hypothetical protein PoB_000785500 [Plakobranchus ocellatus]|uniref:Uncharacterized protein n=1 Tax=Plakobranchus ocellatus TaxID=259542 RepID=A0AAV3YE82_9GAST|nr:hypothetical protein PoB_000785500 [Plakobranchus ocellatus]
MATPTMDERGHGGVFYPKEPKTVFHDAEKSSVKPVLKSSKKVRAPSLPPSAPAPSVLRHSQDSSGSGAPSLPPSAPAPSVLKPSQDSSESDGHREISLRAELVGDASGSGVKANASGLQQAEVKRSPPSSLPVTQDASVKPAGEPGSESDWPQRPPRPRKKIDSRNSPESEHPCTLTPDTLSSLHLVEIQKTASDIPIKNSQQSSVSSTTHAVPKSRSSKTRPAPLPNQVHRTAEVSPSLRYPAAISEGGSIVAQTVMPTKLLDLASLAEETPGQSRDVSSESQPPPLPSSAPPPLPSSPPPLLPPGGALSAAATHADLDTAEEVSVEYTVPIRLTSSTGVLANSSPTAVPLSGISSRDTAPGASNGSAGTISNSATAEKRNDPGKLPNISFSGDNSSKQSDAFTDVQHGAKLSPSGKNANADADDLKQTRVSTESDHSPSSQEYLKPSSAEGDLDSSIDSDISHDDDDEEGTCGNYDLIPPGGSGRMTWSLTSGVDVDTYNPDTTDDDIVLISSTGSLSHQNYSNMEPAIPSHVTASKSSPRLETEKSSASSSKGAKTATGGNFSKVKPSTTEKISSPPNKLSLGMTSVSPIVTKVGHGSPDLNKPLSSSLTSPQEQEHQQLLASTAAIIRNQKCATPRETSPQKPKKLQSPSSSTPSATEHVFKPGGLALFTPSASGEDDQASLKVTKGRDSVAKAMHFADMTEPKAPHFVVRKLQSPSSPTPSATEHVFKPSGLALFTPSASGEDDQANLKVTKGRDSVAKAMHFADMTEPKAPHFVVRKVKVQEGEESNKPAGSSSTAVVKPKGSVRHRDEVMQNRFSIKRHFSRAPHRTAPHRTARAMSANCSDCTAIIARSRRGRVLTLQASGRAPLVTPSLAAHTATASPQQGDLRLSGPPSGQGAGGGAGTRRVPADLRADFMDASLLTNLSYHSITSKSCRKGNIFF